MMMYACGHPIFCPCGGNAVRELLRKMGATTPFTSDLGLLVIRLWFGIVMAVAHGFGKLGAIDGFAANLESAGYPAPVLMALLATLSEAVGGVLIALGLLTRPAALMIFGTMLVAAFVAHADDPFAKKEFALAYGMACLALVIAGPGRWSLDARIFGRKRLETL